MNLLDSILRLSHRLAVLVFIAFASVHSAAHASTATLKAHVVPAECDGAKVERTWSSPAPPQYWQNGDTRATCEPEPSESEGSEEDAQADPPAILAGALELTPIRDLPDQIRHVGPVTCTVQALVSSGLPRGPPPVR